MDSAFVNLLRSEIGGDVLIDSHSRGLYSTDASIYQVMPRGVIVPNSINDAVRSVELLGGRRVSMLPRGGGTSLAGQCVNEAVVVDVSGKCDRLLEVDPENSWCTVESGITVEDLNDQVRSRGVFFAPDPSTARQATVGGCIGNNAAGVHSILYGRTSENVLSIDACMWDGTEIRFGDASCEQQTAGAERRVREIQHSVARVVEQHTDLIRARYPKTLRRSAGYQLDVMLDQLEGNDWDPAGLNLAPLLCGSEGTLAMTLTARLALKPIPKFKGLGVIAFASVEDAIDAVESLLGLDPAGIELLDDLIIDLARKNREQSRYVELLPKLSEGVTRAVVYVEFFAESLERILQSLGGVERVMRGRDGGAVELISDPVAMEQAWKLRKAGEPLLHGVEGDRKPLGFIEDSAIPVDRLGEFVERLRGIVEREGTIASYYAHASVGVLHVRPLLDLRDPADESAMHRIASSCADLAKELGGVASGEHGDGRARGPVLERFMGPELMEAHRMIKAIFDPHHLMNPGNIVDPAPIESISQRTRVRPGATNLTIDGVETGMRFDDEGGFGHAVEMCNGAGVCRKKMVGTMCPSYQGTLDERHSTRGRGNALRLAITGQSFGGDQGGSPQWDDAETLKTLDLCLSCKACKTECPSGVDIAKLKSEYLWQGFQRNGVPFKERVFSRVHLLNRVGALFPALSNSMSRFPPIRSVMNHVLGLHPDRSLPQYARAMKSSPIPADDRPKVLLISDSLSTHSEPRIVASGARVLDAIGFSAGVATVSDLGRAAVSQGDLGFAKKEAERSVKLIEKYIGNHDVEAIVFIEPSSLSVVMDEWADLVGAEYKERVNRIQSLSMLVETFVGQRWESCFEQLNEGGKTSGSGVVVAKKFDQRMIVHTHCHQKALWGSETTMGAFDSICPGSAELIDAGCCGMAGAFGFDAQKFELSNTIGNQRLMPAVRSRGGDVWVVAGGTSCRHQILDATGVHALHPIEAIDRLMHG
ncbi:MAG: FAD-binding and (Fe-S)-binding domain-containing protein [Phycisphaerales bacterium]